MVSKMWMEALSGGCRTSLLAWIQASPAAPWSAYVRVILFLGGLLCCCFVVLRLLGHRVQQLNRSRRGSLELIDRLGFEPRRALYIARAGARYMALAASEAGIHLLMELPPDAFVATPPQPEGERQVS